jgi:hypothetical protein
MSVIDDKVLMFIDEPSDIYTDDSALGKSYILYLVVAIPSSFLGVYSSLTGILQTPIILILAVYLFRLSNVSEERRNKRHILLYMFFCKLATIVSCLLGAFKIVSSAYNVTPLHAGVVILCTALVFFFSVRTTEQRIGNQSIKYDNKKDGNEIVRSVVISAILYIVVRNFLHDIKLEVAVTLVAIALCLVAWISTYEMAIFYLRHHYIRIVGFKKSHTG